MTVKGLPTARPVTMRFMSHQTKYAASLLAFTVGVLSGPAVVSADEVEAAREAADYHMMFLIEHVAPPFRLPDDRLLTCTLEGQPVTIFRGDARLRSGLPANVDVPCWPSAERQPEPPDPNRYYYQDPNAPSTLILWANRIDDRLVALDWIGMD